MLTTEHTDKLTSAILSLLAQLGLDYMPVLTTTQQSATKTLPGELDESQPSSTTNITLRAFFYTLWCYTTDPQSIFEKLTNKTSQSLFSSCTGGKVEEVN